jgi:thermitase
LTSATWDRYYGYGRVSDAGGGAGCYFCDSGHVSGRVTVTLNASDNGAAAITLYIYVDGAMVASGTGSTLSYAWNTRLKMSLASPYHPAVAKDKAGSASSA